MGSCELISICIFTWGFTSDRVINNNRPLLWIDFNLYFYVRIHKFCWRKCRVPTVVNWFQFVFLREDSQVRSLNMLVIIRCELISICIFTWGFTRVLIYNVFKFRLWIDFNLYFYVRIHKSQFRVWLNRLVVNWFQFVFLREDSQVRK